MDIAILTETKISKLNTRKLKLSAQRRGYDIVTAKNFATDSIGCQVVLVMKQALFNRIYYVRTFSRFAIKVSLRIDKRNVHIIGLYYPVNLLAYPEMLIFFETETQSIAADDTILIGGDFNSAANALLDSSGKRKKMTDLMKYLLSLFADSYRTCHPEEMGYTHSQVYQERTIQSRLDYILVNDISSVKSSDILYCKYGVITTHYPSFAVIEWTKPSFTRQIRKKSQKRWRNETPEQLEAYTELIDQLLQDPNEDSDLTRNSDLLIQTMIRAGNSSFLKFKRSKKENRSHFRQLKVTFDRFKLSKELEKLKKGTLPNSILIEKIACSYRNPIADISVHSIKQLIKGLFKLEKQKLKEIKLKNLEEAAKKEASLPHWN